MNGKGDSGDSGKVLAYHNNEQNEFLSVIL